jgi:hypothetical protein
MSGKEGMRSDLPTQLPAGYEALSKQQQWLCERVVFLRRRCLAYESAVMHNLSRLPDQPEKPLPMDAGTYSNHANVLQGHLRTLGLERRQRPIKSLRAHLEAVP